MGLLVAGAVGAAALPYGAIGLALVAGWTPTRATGWVCLLGASAIAFLVARGLYRYLERRMRQGAALLQAIREGDYSVRAPLDDRGGIRELFSEINRLSAELSGARQAGIESDALLGRLLGTIDLAVLVFDPSGHLSGLNRAAGNLLGEPVSDLRGRLADNLGLADWLLRSGEVFVANRLFAAGTGPWEVRVLKFRRGGRIHTLLVMTDASRTLREEERRAWRRLIRVLGHELNNSLGPIASVADTLQRQIASGMEGAGALTEGLELIERRSRNLTDFLRRYSDYARMPPPSFAPVGLATLLRQVILIQDSSRLHLKEGPEVIIQADRAQLEQALINLIRNALEATAPLAGAVRVDWIETPVKVVIEIQDEGPGLPQTENLFVPFFTTKPGGSGIGLLVAREVAENHGGSLELRDRDDRSGAIARLHLAKVPQGAWVRYNRLNP